MSRLSEFLAGERQFDCDNKRERYVDNKGEAGEWEDASDYVWSVEEVRNTYPQYNNLPTFESLLKVFQRDVFSKNMAMNPGDVTLSTLRYLAHIEAERMGRDYPDFLKLLTTLEARVKKLESKQGAR